MRIFELFVVFAFAAACGSASHEAKDTGVDASPEDAERDAAPAEDTGDPMCPDQDGDGLGDMFEGEVLDDLDSDGDGVSDFEEGRGNSCIVPPDDDCDGITNPLDEDSDGDGVPDADEARAGTSLTNPDSDDDGCLDGATCGPNDRLWDGRCCRHGVELSWTVHAERDAESLEIVLESPPPSIRGVIIDESAIAGESLSLRLVGDESATFEESPTIIRYHLEDESGEPMNAGSITIVSHALCRILLI